jgi:hypothetical protein
MPPKKQQGKKQRVPFPDETPLKHTQPGHGAVERAKRQMWSPSEPSSAAKQPATVVKKYKATATSTISIGRPVKKQ